MTIYKLTVFDQGGTIETYFEREEDARKTYSVTYSKVQGKPTWRVEPVEVLREFTHL
jgi:hypothetical protein